MTPERIAEIKQRYNDARKHIGELASTALKAWRMSIPANRERDSDLRIAGSLDDIPDLLTAVETLQADNARLRAALVQARQSIAATYKQTHFMFLENDLAAIDAALEDAR